jgi:predicted dithiol-disulfide oxidoreductase (DUF899 family)
VALDKEYRFETDDGAKTLAELFDGRSQLVVYHFMFGPQYEAGCPVCSTAADSFDGNVVHLNERDVTFLCVSRAPLEKLKAYQRRMGWTFPWVSSQGTDFNFDFDVSRTQEQVAPIVDSGNLGGAIPRLAADCGTDLAGYIEERPGLSAFTLSDGVVYHTYSTYHRGLEPLLGFYPLIDRTARGRDEGDPPKIWMRRHDEYEAARAG